MRRYALQDLRSQDVTQLLILIPEVISQMEDLLIGEDLRILEWMSAEIKIIRIGNITLKMGDDDLMNVPKRHQKQLAKQFDELVLIWTQLFPIIDQEWKMGPIRRYKGAHQAIKLLKQQQKLLT